jgi:sugar lactone lactonase YvrE
VAEDQGKEEEKFDFTPEGEGYISLDEARVLAMRTAVETPGNYGSAYQGVDMFFEVVEATETDDFYYVTLSFRPQGNFDGTPGQEQFVVGKEGTISVRQVHSFPAQTLTSPVGTERRGGLPLIPVAVGLVLVGAIAVVGVVFAISSSGGDRVPVAAVSSSMKTQDTSETLAPTYTPRPAYTPAPTLTPNPTPYLTNTSVPTPLSTATLYPTPTPHPTSTPKPPSGLVFVSEWGRYPGSGDGQFKHPYGIAVASGGNVYVADTDNHRIQKFTSEGVFVSKWGTAGTGDGQFGSEWNGSITKGPDAIAVASDGSVYVVDGGNDRIQKFTSEGVFVSKWDTKAIQLDPDSAQTYTKPQGVAVASDGSVYVADFFNGIQKFTSEGVFVTKWGTGVTSDELIGPSGIAVSSDGSVYVADGFNHHIQKFTSEGVFVSKWGRFQGPGDGDFDHPQGVAVASDGSVYVADTGNSRIQKFSVGQ